MSKRKVEDIEDHDSSDSDIWSSSEESQYSDEEFGVFDESDSSDENEPDQIDAPLDETWEYAGIPRPCFSFTGTSGIQIPSLNQHNILDIFESFFTDELVDIIVLETNRYASKYQSNKKENLKPHSRVHQWVDTNRKEIRTFLGLLILQGICSKPESRLYFTKRESIATPFFSRIMTERRFLLIQKFLHFTNDDNCDNTSPNNKLYKILPILDYLRKKFMSVYIPNKFISIDESLIGWKGRLSWKQFIPTKRKRFGIKVYALCESESGYVYNFIIYTGRTTVYGNSHYSDEPISSRIVLELSHVLLNKGYCIYIDNFYTNVDLMDKLTENKTDCIGTIRKNRSKIPNEIKLKKLKKGELFAMYRKKLMILKWKDKKEITMGSTVHDESKELVKSKNGKLVEKPAVVVDYNSKMGGVDLADNHLHFYSTVRCRVKKYYMKIFRHFLDITILNSYKIYTRLGGKKSRLNFNCYLGEIIVEKYAEKKETPERRSKRPKPSRLLERHFPDFLPPTENKEKPTRRCVICYEKGIRKESRYWCEDCKTGLCPAPCFRAYHTKN